MKSHHGSICISGTCHHETTVSLLSLSPLPCPIEFLVLKFTICPACLYHSNTTFKSKIYQQNPHHIIMIRSLIKLSLAKPAQKMQKLIL